MDTISLAKIPTPPQRYTSAWARHMQVSKPTVRAVYANMARSMRREAMHAIGTLAAYSRSHALYNSDLHSAMTEGYRSWEDTMVRDEIAERLLRASKKAPD